jgi:two-component system KDP operon response regulator KdpE
MDKNFKILIIEDDKYISSFTALSLGKEGYEVFVAESGAKGLFLFSLNHPDMLLLDLGLPDQDGLKILKELRGISQIPILVVSARGQEQEKIEALDAGADDYITKPFFMGELMARIRVAQRKAEKTVSPEKESLFQKDNLKVDFEKRRVTIDNLEIHLTPIEYKLLILLLENKGKVLTHNYILRQVWGYDEGGDSKTVRVFMANLRRKIEKDTTNPQFILTEVGVGYRFVEE